MAGAAAESIHGAIGGKHTTAGVDPTWTEHGPNKDQVEFGGKALFSDNFVTFGPFLCFISLVSHLLFVS